MGLIREALNKSALSIRDASKVWPSAAKAAYIAGLNGTAEAVPFQSHWEINFIRGSLGPVVAVSDVERR
jgi:hypothetical protein